jgi:hypothetical protein
MRKVFGVLAGTALAGVGVLIWMSTRNDWGGIGEIDYSGLWSEIR